MVNASVQYRNAVKKKLLCSKPVKKRLLQGLDNALLPFLEENPSPMPEELLKAFGPPEEMARVLMADITPQENANFRKKVLLRRILAWIIAVVLILSSVYIFFMKEFSITVTHEVYEVTTTNGDGE